MKRNYMEKGCAFNYKCNGSAVKEVTGMSADGVRVKKKHFLLTSEINVYEIEVTLQCDITHYRYNVQSGGTTNEPKTLY